ncbi:MULTISPECIES: type II toxin-antitoxin system VapC family toxin [unclassified Bradyrhizobium]|jgi:predicted nucleic acid-binding protein|uniref:type II toxin-antitoxin system VapC family toxin n=1 Tax=unclassified Bradyrhizobium TaxID=2631580 RepID=UPI001BCC0BD2|nr:MULTISPECIES: type II toxin-antitoxin system VapC family toxin [unclassified Bradyrhizobium]MCK1642542.1 type II toxin-antitoxin system VapC family toxin [Bradyrhizobium sp. 157]WOH50939.1 type II toxin-antitoxin system VapC family toxin [Bradyrhizobium sp. sBnM-33]
MTLVDSNVLLDVITDGEVWADWAQEQLEQAASSGPLVINDVIYSEISTRYATVEGVDAMLRNLDIDLATIPRAALFLAGKAYLRYRSAGGLRTGVLADFFIGAHAAVEQLPLLTRDAKRYRTYFPTLELITPEREQ